jgi:hypothetical protein
VNQLTTAALDPRDPVITRGRPCGGIIATGIETSQYAPILDGLGPGNAWCPSAMRSAGDIKEFVAIGSAQLVARSSIITPALGPSRLRCGGRAPTRAPVTGRLRRRLLSRV